MNQIQLIPDVRDFTAPGGQVVHELHTSVVLDGEPVGDRHVLDWREVFRTLRYSGEMFFWTSANGEPLEEDIQDHVEVRREGEVVTWKWSMPISLHDLKPGQVRPPRTATFDAAEYEHAIRLGWWQACKLSRAQRHLYVFPRDLGDAGLLMLDDWLQTDEARPFEPAYITRPVIAKN